MMRAPRDLCIMACVFCRDPLFLEWLSFLEGKDEPVTEGEAKLVITGLCGIESRNQLDQLPAAAARFHAQIREPFIAWKNALDGALAAGR